MCFLANHCCVSEAYFPKMPNNIEIKKEVKLVNTIQSVSAQTNVGAPSCGSRGDAIDWKKKYEEEFDKRSGIEEQNDDLQSQVLLKTGLKSVQSVIFLSLYKLIAFIGIKWRKISN